MEWLKNFGSGTAARAGPTVAMATEHTTTPTGTASASTSDVRMLPRTTPRSATASDVGLADEAGQHARGTRRLPNTSQVRAPLVVAHRKQPEPRIPSTAGAVTPITTQDEWHQLMDDAPAEFESVDMPHSAANPVVTMRHRLRTRASVWSAFITSALVMGWITGGMPLLWTGAAPEPRRMHNHPSALEHSSFVGKAIRDMMTSKTIMALARAPHVVSALGVVAKKGSDKFRLIWDGRYINAHLHIPTFHYEDLRAIGQWAEPNDYAFTMDLKSGYHHLDMHEDAWQYLGFQWEGQYYCFTQLPFGLAPACWAFTKLTRSVMTVFRQRGVRCTGYIDDSMYFNAERSALAETQVQVLTKHQELGFIVNIPKSRLDILQHAPYLGMEVDFQAGVMRVPPEKLQAIRELLSTAIHNKRQLSVRALAAIKGKLIAIRWSVGHAAFFFTKAIDADIAARRSWNSHISLSHATVAELQFWLQHFHIFDGTWPIWQPPGHDVVIHVDAAGAAPSYVGGWGAVLRRPNAPHLHRLTAQGHWRHIQSASGSSSTSMELLGVLSALQSFLHVGSLAGTTVQVVTDSHNVFTHMTTGRVRADASVKIVQDIFLFVFQHKIRVSYQWVPREKNVEADALSKLQGGDDEHRLHESVFQHLQSEHGPFSVDLFASHTNHLLPMYYSRHYTPTTSGVDAFAQPWQGVCWAHPPFAMLDQVLRYAALALASLCLVCPFWPAAAWWRRICDTDSLFAPCVHAATVLPDRHDLCIAQSRGHGQNRNVRPRWPLMALRLNFAQPVPTRVRVPIVLQRMASRRDM
jgi:ribonuclease HI